MKRIEKEAKTIIEITEDIQLPGTDTVLEVGDRIEVLTEGYASSEMAGLQTPPYKIQVRDFDGNSTKWMNVDQDVLSALNNLV